MTNHTDDDKFDAWLQGEVRDYNRPPAAVPRGEMWTAIDGALDAAERAPATSARPTMSRRRVTPIWWQAAAAALLVAAGIGIGRIWSARDSATVVTDGATDSGRGAPGSDSALRSSVAAMERVDTPQGVDGGASTGAGTAPRAAARAAAGDDPMTGNGSLDAAAGRSYDVATLQHLSRAEALLTSFRAGDGTGTGASGASSMDRWARDLLADTRLFLDSPGARDVRRRELLLDLELVLAQIVQLPAESSADRGLVQRSIERGAVLSRLRSTIPAGYTSGT